MGDFRITGDKIEKRIESNKLRLIYNRRPCADLDDVACQGKNVLGLYFHEFCHISLTFD